MRLQLLSDLHFEFHRDAGRSLVDSLDPAGIDVLVLAGDICNAAAIPDALGLFCERYRHASVVYVHGNHEFYRTDRADVVARTRQAVSDNSNLVWLDCSSAELHGRRFLGAPLWFPDHPSIPRLKRSMSDFHEIRGFEGWVYAENERAIAFLRDALREGDIVITHHLPSRRSVSPRFVGHPLGHFFVCDVEPLIQERQPRLWLHGHTHDSVHYDIGNTTVLCNPLGYVGIDLNSAFSDAMVIDV
jgi:Icc-related predicted phosphoesterase